MTAMCRRLLNQRSGIQRHANRRDRGAAVVELALLLPVLMFLMVVGVDFCRVFYFSQVLGNCARNGALYAADAKSAARNLYSSTQNAALADAGDLSPQPTVTSASGTDSAGNAYVTVTVTWQFNTLTSFPGIPNETLTRTVRMRKVL